MYRNLGHCIFICFIFIFNFAFGNEKWSEYPKFIDVVSHFESQVGDLKISTVNYIDFEKNKDGYYVVKKSKYDANDFEKWQLWSYKSKAFQEVSIENYKNEDGNLVDFNQHKRFVTAHLYDVCPYFGYDGWAYDVTLEYNGDEFLPDSILYGIGRAYSTKASNLLHNNSATSIDSLRFDLSIECNSLSSAQLEQYLFYRKKAIEIFERLTQSNPNYKTIVGSIGVKASNEHITQLLDLQIFQNELVAESLLGSANYAPFMEDYAKFTLDFCPENAILFTQGDNDTYPLIYYQTKYKYRTDIAVVNISLIANNRYLNYLTQDCEGKKKINSFLKPYEHFTGTSRNALYLIDDKNEPIELNDLFNYFANDDAASVSTRGSKFYTSQTDNVIINRNGNKMECKLKKPYTLRNSLSILDFISNNPDRPICFSNTVSSAYHFKLSDHLLPNGNNWLLMDKSKYDLSFIEQDSTRILNNINKLKSNNYDLKVEFPEHADLCYSLRYAYFELIDLLKYDYPNKANEVFNGLNEKFPVESLCLDFFTLKVLNHFLFNNDTEAYKQYLYRIVKGLENESICIKNNQNSRLYFNFKNANDNLIKTLNKMAADSIDNEIKTILERIVIQIQQKT